MMGRAGSIGFPKKNIKKVLGRHLFEYPLIASKNSKYIDKIFVSTDCPVITRVSKKYGAIHIKRPKKLTTNKALGEHVYEHGYFEIKKILDRKSTRLNSSHKPISYAVFCLKKKIKIRHYILDYYTHLSHA